MGVHDGRHREEARFRADVAIQIEYPGYPSREDHSARPGAPFPGCAYWIASALCASQ